MRKFIFIIPIVVVLLFIGCQEKSGVLNQTSGENAQNSFLAKGTETLGPPEILIGEGSGIVAAGTGLVGVSSGNINLNVPGDVVQALIYWSGGTDVDPITGDNTINVNGTGISGELIGGPAYFYGNYHFFAYRKDITNMVSAGANSFTISGMDFAYTGNDENCGASILVIYNDGSLSEIDLRDGLDLAFFNFSEPRQTTIPQTFYFSPADQDRIANLTNFAGSVGVNRPNEIKVTINGDVQSFINPFGSNDGLLWDTAVLDVNIPSGTSELTVQAISTPSDDPLGASLCWVTTALSVPVIEQEPAEIGDFVWEDLNHDGIQDQGEPGIVGVIVHLMDCSGNLLAEAVTDANGFYLFTGLMPGNYNIHFVKPEGYNFSPQNMGTDDALDSDANMDGLTECTSLEAGETDLTWDAGLYMPPDAPGTGTPGYWKNHPDAWPVEEITIGGITYSKSEAIYNMEHAVKKDKTYTLFASLLAAKLNVLIGNDDSCISDAIDYADEWMSIHPVGSMVKANSPEWKDAEPYHLQLDDYNNGRLPCADHRD